jgi:hypothetical protein
VEVTKASKMWLIHTVEYHSALKRKGILTQTTICMHYSGMNPEDIMLSEINQTQKDKYYTILPIVITLE